VVVVSHGTGGSGSAMRWLADGVAGGRFLLGGYPVAALAGVRVGNDAVAFFLEHLS
jgi:hypothetical protein